jgi:hypothetical protein
LGQYDVYLCNWLYTVEHPFTIPYFLSFGVQFQLFPITNPSAELPLIKGFLSLVFKPTALQRNLKMGRVWKVLTMVYNTQDYWVFWTFPSSGILQTRKQDVSETGSVSLLRWTGGSDTDSVGPLRKSSAQSQVPLFTWGRKHIQFPKRRVF